MFDYTFKAQFDDLSEDVLTSKTWLDTVLARMGIMVGEREGDELRRSGRKAFFEVPREQKETLSQYVSRREAQLLEAEGN
eukprot:370820-Pyramimonas_sp.AAC.2